MTNIQPELNGYILRPEYQLPQHYAILEWARKNYKLDGLKVRVGSKEATIPIKHPPVFVDNSVGAGKTVTIGAIARHTAERGGQVMVLARQGEIIQQNSDEAWAMGCKNSIYSASLGLRQTTYPVIMGTEGTVSNYLNTTFKSLKVDLLMIDECHQVGWDDLIRSYCDPSYETKNQYTAIIKHLIQNNPKIRILGLTGSPFRGTEDIKGQFWRECIYQVSTMFLVSLGYLVPPVFGAESGYDLSEFKPSGGRGDFDRKDLLAMQRKVTKEEEKTRDIVNQIIESTQGTGGVLITCAGKKHCEQVASFLPEGSWGIVTDSTSTKERRRILDGAKSGAIKYVLQIGCLTTGVNIPIWQYCVILRRIGSLTLLVQLIGRVLRTLKPEQIKAGLVKDNAFIIDFSGTIEAMGDIYSDDQALSEALLSLKNQNPETQECPKCQEENTIYAVRCRGLDMTEPDKRCGHYFQFALCFKCETKNAPSAQMCRGCGGYMIDPNDALLNKAYTDTDYKPVLNMQLEPNKSGGLTVKYLLASMREENGLKTPEIAIEYHQPFGTDNASRGRWAAFLRSHVRCNKMIAGVYKFRSIAEIIKSKAVFAVPTDITHRVNPKGFSVITHKKYKSGREEQ